MKQRLFNVLRWVFGIIIAMPVVLLMIVEACFLYAFEYILFGNKYPFMAAVYWKIGKWIFKDDWN